MTGRTRPPEGDVITAFRDAMSAAGFNPRSIDPDLPDFVRFDAPGDKAGKKNGFYKLKTGIYPVGWFGDWKTGEQHQWEFWDAAKLSSKEQKQMRDEHRRLKAEAQLEREAKWAERAEDAQAIWDKASPDVAGHPYLERKLITTPKGLRLHTSGDGTQLVVVPMWGFDMNGNPKLWNLQFISGDGTKRFMKAAKIDGTFFSLRGSSDHNLIVECEGTATGFTIWQATGLGILVAFNGGNLLKAAREFQVWRPLTDILIAGDNDVMAPDDWAEKGHGKPWVNVGAKSAERTARAVDAKFILPHFSKGPSRSRTDFNDLHREEGLEAVNKQVWGALAAPVMDEGDGPDAPAPPKSENLQDESWRSMLPKTSSGMLDGGNVEGVSMFLQNHRLLVGRVAFNQFTKEVEVDGATMQKHHVAEFRKIMHSERYKARKDDVSDEMDAEARRNQYDPLQVYLGSLKWDGSKRIGEFLIDYFGAADTPYNRAIGARFLIGAVARARKPGVKMDNMPVLEGPQGIGKSTAIRYLFGERFFIDDVSDFSSKDTFQLIQGAWVCEIAELSAMHKSEINEVKKFLTKQQDKFRAPYERAPISVPRRTVFVGTVNPEPGQGYLKDPTGGRRFWPVECGNIDLRGILRDRDQIWAEAVSAYEAGAKWHLDDPKLVGLAETEQHARREVHPWEEIIASYVAGGVSGRVKELTVAQVLQDIIRLPVDRRNVIASREVGRILRAMGWVDEVRRISGVPTKVFVDPEGDAMEASNDWG